MERVCRLGQFSSAVHGQNAGIPWTDVRPGAFFLVGFVFFVDFGLIQPKRAQAFFRPAGLAIFGGGSEPLEGQIGHGAWANSFGPKQSVLNLGRFGSGFWAVFDGLNPTRPQ